MALKRLNREIQAMGKDPLENMSAGPTEDNIMNWTATIIG